MGDLLQKQVGLYQETIEPWKAEHDLVMAKYDCADGLSDVVRFGLFVFDNIHRLFESEACERSFDAVLTVKGCTELWHSASVKVIELAKSDFLKGFPVEGVEELQGKIAIAQAMLGDLDDAEAAIESYRDNSAVSVETFLDELRAQIQS